MSQLEKRKSKLVLTTSATYRQGRRLKKIMLELKPEFAWVWLAGSRTRLPINYASIYERAAWIRVMNERLEKARAKKAAKKRRKR